MVEATHCPACGHVNAIAAEACASCGAPLSAADIPVHPGETFRDPDDLSFPDAPPERGKKSDPKRAVAIDREHVAAGESEAEALRTVAESMRRRRAASASFGAPQTGARPAHYAGFVIRLVAFAIDALVLFIFTVPLTAAAISGVRVGLVASGTHVIFLDTQEALGRLITIAWLSMAAIYFAALHTGTGQTIGKAVVGIAVRRARDLAGIGFFRSLVRVVGYALSSFLFFAGFLSIMLGPRKRGWHDYLAGTCVVHLAPEEV
jgi:uncharacterized RDD family membrane protein YckC